MKSPALVGTLLGLLVLSASPSLAVAGAPANVPKMSENTRFVVYYFHGNFRCPTCLKIEQLSARTVREAFEEQMGRGFLEWKAMDIDRPENKHFSADFDLSSPTLVVARFEGEEMRAFQKLDKVWELVEGDERKFEAYVFGEVDRFLSK
jgi:hypothetical protein